MTRIDILVVGAGFSGAVVAERLASHGLKVLVIDKRSHVGGNAHDRLDGHGVLIHPYGPHIFHTNGLRIAEYLSQFTEWRAYEHRVLAKVGEQLVPIPINVDTVNRVYGLSLTQETIGAFFESVREPRSPIRTSEDVVLNAVGRDLYEKFFRGYTRKQWGLDPSQLAASVAARIPTRTNHDFPHPSLEPPPPVAKSPSSMPFPILRVPDPPPSRHATPAFEVLHYVAAKRLQLSAKMSRMLA